MDRRAASRPAGRDTAVPNTRPAAYDVVPVCCRITPLLRKVIQQAAWDSRNICLVSGEAGSMPAPCLRHAAIPRTDTRLYATGAAGRTPSGTGRPGASQSGLHAAPGALPPGRSYRAARRRARSIQPSCSRYQRTVRSMPSSSPTRGCQPSSSRMRAVSMA